MDPVGYIFIFALGAFAGSLATSWANVLFLEPAREEEQDIVNKIDRYM